jgi:two-component system response regulator MtrA
MSPSVLVVEDDPSVREAVTLVLEEAGFEVECAVDGDQGVDAARFGTFDLVLLDLMLPGTDGFQVCSQIRNRSSVPIVMLTARTESPDVVTGLALGADDYVTKPFVPAELVARARAAIRRASGDVCTPWQVRDLEIDESAVSARRGGEDLGLTAMELRLLAALARRPGEAVSREELLERVWGYDYLGDSRLVDMAVLRLRAKLGDPDEEPAYIATVRSVGYRFERA